jgi:hypothetical protein
MLSVFHALLIRLYDWLSCADPVCHGDLIFVLAGRQSRKVFGLQLFSEKRAPNLLVTVGRFEIRRFANLAWPVHVDLLQIAKPVPPPERWFFVSSGTDVGTVELVRRGRFGTLSEIRALAAWLKRHPNINSVLVVTSGSHLRRVRMCCRNLLPRYVQIRLLAASDDGGFLGRDGWWRDRETRRIVLYEFPKLLLYWPVLQFKWLRRFESAVPDA